MVLNATEKNKVGKGVEEHMEMGAINLGTCPEKPSLRSWD